MQKVDKRRIHRVWRSAFFRNEERTRASVNFDQEFRVHVFLTIYGYYPVGKP